MAGVGLGIGSIDNLSSLESYFCPNQLENVGVKHSLGTLLSLSQLLRKHSGKPRGVNQDVLPLPHWLNRIYTGV